MQYPYVWWQAKLKFLLQCPAKCKHNLWTSNCSSWPALLGGKSVLFSHHPCDISQTINKPLQHRGSLIGCCRELPSLLPSNESLCQYCCLCACLSHKIPSISTMQLQHFLSTKFPIKLLVDSCSTDSLQTHDVMPGTIIILFKWQT